MIPNKERKNHQKMTQLVQIPDNDLCTQFNKLDLKSSEKNIFSEESDLTNIIDECTDNIDVINKIEEKFNNIKIVNENDVSANSEKLKNTVSEQVFNIACDNFQEENGCKEEQFPRTLEGQANLGGNDYNKHEKTRVNNALKERNIEEEDNARDISSCLNCEVQKEDKDFEINKNINEIHSESKKSDKNEKKLCSRGPVFAPKFSQSSYQPYDKGTWINSTNCQSAFLSGGEVLQVAEPLAQPTSSYQQWNDVSNFNVIRNELEELASHTCPVSLSPPVASVAPVSSVSPFSPVSPVSPVVPVASFSPDVPIAPTTQPSIAAPTAPAPPEQTSFSSVFDENDNDTLDIIKTMYDNFPQIRSAVDSIKITNVNCPRFRSTVDKEVNKYTETKCALPQEVNLKDDGLPSSPSGSERSPPGSLYGSLQRPPPSTSEDSGTESSPLDDFMSDNSLLSPRNDRTAMWVQASQTKHDLPKFRPILPKPAIVSIRSRFQKILDPERKLQAWAKIQAQPDNFFCHRDEDGDTQLMIVVCNDVEGQLELIYAMVERMRKIPNALNIKNNIGLSALYLACKLLHKQPLVAAYIAEALLEQKVDIANLRYVNDLSLPEILENEGETHDAVLKELLAVKDNCGRFAFPMYHQNEFCYKELSAKHLNLPNCL